MPRRMMPIIHEVDSRAPVPQGATEDSPFTYQRGQVMVTAVELLKRMVDLHASDVFIKANNSAHYRVDGQILPSGEVLSAEDSERIANELMNKEQAEKFRRKNELDSAYTLVEGTDWERYRMNVFRERGQVSLVLRLVRKHPIDFSRLNLPEQVLQGLCNEYRGLIVVTGPAGSGKTTTLVSMVDYINSTRRSHIVTIEDPIEFIHQDKNGIINQREVGLDTDSFADALRQVVRQSPDVIMIGEMRDLHTVAAAINAAETGHLVLTSLHTLHPTQTVERMINFYPPYQRDEVRMQLSFVLRGVVSLRLVPRADGKGRVPAVSTMIVTQNVRQLIQEGKLNEIRDAIRAGEYHGMQSFDQCLILLYKEGLINFEDAVAASDSPGDFKLHAKGIRSESEPVGAGVK